MLLSGKLVDHIGFRQLAHRGRFSRHRGRHFIRHSLIRAERVVGGITALVHRQCNGDTTIVNLGTRLAGRVRECLKFSRGGHSVGSCRRTRSTLYINVTKRFTTGHNFFTSNRISSNTRGSCGRCLHSCLHKCHRGLDTRSEGRNHTFNFVINSVHSRSRRGQIGPHAKRII